MFNNFRLSYTDQENLTIIIPDGYINNAAGDEIAELFLQLIENGKRHFLVDMKKVTAINSVGVSSFIEAIEKLQPLSGKLSFCNAEPIIEKTFQVMGISLYSESFKTKDEAIQALTK